MRKTIILLALVVLLVIPGCGGAKEVSDPNEVKLTAALDAYIQDEISTHESLPMTQRFQNAILKKITYDIQSYDIANGTMSVEFTYVDVLHLSDEFTEPDITEDEYYRHCVERISSDECKMITEKIQVSFETTEEGFVIISSEPLTNVMTGGVLNYYLELLEGMDYE